MLRNVEKLIIMEWTGCTLTPSNLYSTEKSTTTNLEENLYSLNTDGCQNGKIAGACVLNIPLHYSSSQS